MHLRIGAWVCVFALGFAVKVAAQQKVCSLLTTAEVSAALGSSKAGVEGEMPVPGAPQGATMKMCSWPLGTGAGGMHLSVSRMDPKVTFDSLVSMSFQMYDQLKAQGWTEDRKDFGSVKCVVVRPPAGKQQAGPPTTSCLAQAKGMFLGASTITSSPVSMDKLKTLVDSAIARL